MQMHFFTFSGYSRVYVYLDSQIRGQQQVNNTYWKSNDPRLLTCTPCIASHILCSNSLCPPTPTIPPPSPPLPLMFAGTIQLPTAPSPFPPSPPPLPPPSPPPHPPHQSSFLYVNNTHTSDAIDWVSIGAVSDVPAARMVSMLDV